LCLPLREAFNQYEAFGPVLARSLRIGRERMVKPIARRGFFAFERGRPPILRCSIGFAILPDQP
jgi:hypothetical protein